ncbi:MAG: hypothetical protein QNJ20_06100 [Paracoccaceae bacterium]|nr:hypothetical protein [Paracoccaceae bacterium]
MYRISTAAALVALMGCAGSVPDSNPNAGGGVGFGNYDQYASQRAARDAALERPVASAPVTEEMVIAQETMGVLNDTAAEPVTTASVEPNVATAPVSDNPTISDEQDFAAVSTRETIESDRDRLQRQRNTFEVAAPEAVPDRPSGRAAPNIVAYALSTNNAVGQPAYDRPSRFNEDRYRRSCAEFTSPDQAQAAFLAAGGPARDRRGLDPDGDGFACFWDPTPFRNARGG